MKDIALVLSGGGARGYAHIGAIKVLEQYGFRITSIAGTSMGALIGGIYATGQLDAFEKWLISLDIREILRLTDITISKKGLVKGEKVIKKIKEIVPDRNIEDLRIPFCAVATDILSGKEVLFTRGDLYEAIRASISIPTVFQPPMIGDRYMVDGGILNPVPVNRVLRSGNDMLVVVNVCSTIPFHGKIAENERIPDKRNMRYAGLIREKLSNLKPAKKRQDIGIFNLSNRSIATMIARISELTLEIFHPDLLISVSKDSYNAYDFYKAKEIIKEGETAALQALKMKNLT